MQSTITDWGSAVMTSLTGALALFFAALPKILGFVIILVAGWAIAWLVEKGLNSLLRTVHFNDFAARAGLSDFIAKTGRKTDAAGMFGMIAKWFVRLIALVVAFDALGLPAVSGILQQLLLWLPNLVVALMALVIGGIAAAGLGNLVRGAAAEGGLQRPDFLAKTAKVAVWAFAIVVAVNQLGIATELVNTLFMATVGAVALALGLAFGLGGRETAGLIVRRWYLKGQEAGPQLERAAGAAAERIGAAGSGSFAGSGSSGPSYSSSSYSGANYPGEERRSGSDRRNGPDTLQ